MFALPLVLLGVPSSAPFLFADGNYEKAVECAKTYLLFFPSDEVMTQNLAYYTAVLGENLAGPIQPREVSNLLRCRDIFSPPWGPLQSFWGLSWLHLLWSSHRLVAKWRAMQDEASWKIAEKLKSITGKISLAKGRNVVTCPSGNQ